MGFHEKKKKKKIKNRACFRKMFTNCFSYNVRVKATTGNCYVKKVF